MLVGLQSVIFCIVWPGCLHITKGLITAEQDAPWGSTQRVKSGEVAKAQTGSCRRLECLMWTQRRGGRHSAWMKSVPTWVWTVRGEVPGFSEVGIRVYCDQRRVWWGKWPSYLLPRVKRWIAASFHLCYLTETGGLQTQEGSFIYTEQPCWLQHSFHSLFFIILWFWSKSKCLLLVSTIC